MGGESRQSSTCRGLVVVVVVVVMMPLGPVVVEVDDRLAGGWPGWVRVEGCLACWGGSDDSTEARRSASASL